MQWVVSSEQREIQKLWACVGQSTFPFSMCSLVCVWWELGYLHMWGIWPLWRPEINSGHLFLPLSNSMFQRERVSQWTSISSFAISRSLADQQTPQALLASVLRLEVLTPHWAFTWVLNSDPHACTSGI